MRCNYCEWRCDLGKSDGVCGRYTVKDGEIAEKEPFKWIDYYSYQIESMPFYHVYPDSVVIQTGTVSCNAKCCYCINSHLAIEHKEQALKTKDAEQFVDLVKRTGAKGVVFSVNEVTCFIPSAIGIAEALHKEGLMCGCLTNGFQTEETAELLAEHMDCINVSLKSISDEFYRNDLGLPSVQPVLRNIGIFSRKTHLEIVTPLVHEIVSGGEIYKIMDFLCDTDPEMVWHLFRLMPNYKRTDERDMTHEEMLEIYSRIREKMPYTYLGNFAGSRWIDTVCPGCGATVVKRISTGAWLGGTLRNSLKDGCCPKCGRKIPGVY